MTTHSPSTVALAPDGAVFRLDRGSTEIKPASRLDMISILTAGLVTVARTSKFCFVEDEDDVAFYSCLYEILSDYGPSRDQQALAPGIPLAFIPASLGTGSAKIPGGATVVRKWVGKLDAEPLQSTFYGIVDRDSDNAEESRIFVIGRYSFENYLLDPLVLFALVLENGTAPLVPGVQITGGDEHRLRSLGEADLQKISDTICSLIQASDASLTGVPRKQVTFTSGKNIDVPSWVIDHRGHDLLPIAQQALGGPSLVNPVRLLKAFRRARIIPVELASLLSRVQVA